MKWIRKGRGKKGEEKLKMDRKWNQEKVEVTCDLYLMTNIENEGVVIGTEKDRETWNLGKD